MTIILRDNIKYLVVAERKTLNARTVIVGAVVQTRVCNLAHRRHGVHLQHHFYITYVLPKLLLSLTELPIVQATENYCCHN